MSELVSGDILGLFKKVRGDLNSCCVTESSSPKNEGATAGETPADSLTRQLHRQAIVLNLIENTRSLPYHAAPYHWRCKKPQLQSKVPLRQRTRLSVRSVSFRFSRFSTATRQEALSGTKASFTTLAPAWRFFSSPSFPSSGASPYRLRPRNSTAFFPFKAVSIAGLAPRSEISGASNADGGIGRARF